MTSDITAKRLSNDPAQMRVTGVMHGSRQRDMFVSRPRFND